MSKFIFGEKKWHPYFDLRKTQLLLDFARNAAYELASQGKKYLCRY